MQQFSVSKKKFGRIGVFLGGKSKERPISLKSGTAVYEALIRTGQDAVLIDTANGFQSKLKNKSIDVAFLALHGTGGEDGTVQKILDRYRIPYTGSGPKASKSAFNKGITKKMLLRAGIPTPAYAVINSRNWKSIVKGWRPPYVVKPLQEGSSIGIFFVEGKKIIPKLFQSGLKRYGHLMVERKIEGREFTVGILGRKALPVIELRPKRRFYDFKAKYTKGLTDYLAPAPITDNLKKKLQRIALKTHQVLGLEGFSRVDFKVDSANRPYVLEANSIPGFTETSLLPKAAKCVGLSFEDLCLYLLNHAVGKKRKS